MTDNPEDILYAPISNTKEVADEQPTFSLEEISVSPPPPPPPPYPPAGMQSSPWVSHGVDADPEWLPLNEQTALVPNGGMRVPGAHADREAMLKHEVDRLRTQIDKLMSDTDWISSDAESYWIKVYGGTSNTGTISNE